MLIGRLLGWILVLAGIIVVARDGMIWFKDGTYPLITGGEVWYSIDVDSLNLVQAVVQRYLSPEVWDPGIQTVLLWPAAATLAGTGVILLALFFRR
mgnify:CR=1 FL=1|jgi:hypothetical protein